MWLPSVSLSCCKFFAHLCLGSYILSLISRDAKLARMWNLDYFLHTFKECCHWWIPCTVLNSTPHIPYSISFPSCIASFSKLNVICSHYCELELPSLFFIRNSHIELENYLTHIHIFCWSSNNFTKVERWLRKWPPGSKLALMIKVWCTYRTHRLEK